MNHREGSSSTRSRSCARFMGMRSKCGGGGGYEVSAGLLRLPLRLTGLLQTWVRGEIVISYGAQRVRLLMWFGLCRGNRRRGRVRGL